MGKEGIRDEMGRNGKGKDTKGRLGKEKVRRVMKGNGYEGKRSVR